jgi:hypothetical protein
MNFIEKLASPPDQVAEGSGPEIGRKQAHIEDPLFGTFLVPARKKHRASPPSA